MNKRQRIGHGFVLAWQFLLRIPFPFQASWDEHSVRWALCFYPFIGSILGAILISTYALLDPFVPLWMLVIIIMTLWIGLSGGLHLDGWMDVADAIGSNGPRDKKVAIMKDPHVGSFGILAAIGLIVWKGALLYTLLEAKTEAWLVVLVIIPALARWSALLLLHILPPLRKSGFAWECRKRLNWITIGSSLVPIIMAMFYTTLVSSSGWQLFPYLFGIMVIGIACYCLWVLLVSMYFRHHFGAVNGDMAGATIEGGEAWGLLLISICIWFGTV